MNPTALIAEDEPLLAQHLQSELALLWPELRVVALAPDGDDALALTRQHRPDVLFLDVKMPGPSGLDVAELLAEDWPDGVPFPLLVFATAYGEHALAAFERAAIDYLQKPLRRERLAQTCERLQAQLRQRQGGALDAVLAQLRTLQAPTPAAEPLRLLQASQGAQIRFVPVDEVLYFEAADKYVRVLTATQEHLVRLSLRELLAQLDPARFWQIHRSMVVRADAIAHAERDDQGRLTLHLRERPERLPVSRVHATRFKAM